MSTGNIWKEAEKDIILHENRLNVIESCLDRHARLQPGKLAFAFELESGKIREYTYKELYEEANKFANYLNKLKAKEGSRVFIFLPKVPELYISFLGTIKQGSIAAPLFEKAWN
jgi:acetyl-CoA synthetase